MTDRDQETALNQPEKNLSGHTASFTTKHLSDF
jgi:hypothetical protein